MRDDAGLRSAFDRRFDAVCHLAALVRARESRADPVGFWRTNVGGTLAVLAALAAQEGPPARLVVASTCAVYGEHAAQPIDEAVAAPADEPVRVEQARRRPGRRRPGRDRGDRCGEPASVQRRRRAPGARGPRRDAARPQGRRGGPGAGGGAGRERRRVRGARLRPRRGHGRRLRARPRRVPSRPVDAPTTWARAVGAPSRTSSPRWRRSRAVRCRSATARRRRNRRSCWPMPPDPPRARVAAGAVGPAPDRRRRLRRSGRMIAAERADERATNCWTRLACPNAGLAPTPPRVLRRRTRVLRYGT